MRKSLALLFVLSGLAYAGPRNSSFVDQIGPGTSANSVFISSSAVSGARSCLTSVVVTTQRVSNSGSITVNLLDGGTTNYIVDSSTGLPVQLSFPEGNAWCASPNRQIGITATTLNGATVDINYQGFSYVGNIGSGY